MALNYIIVFIVIHCQVIHLTYSTDIKILALFVWHLRFFLRKKGVNLVNLQPLLCLESLSSKYAI